MEISQWMLKKINISGSTTRKSKVNHKFKNNFKILSNHWGENTKIFSLEQKFTQLILFLLFLS